MSFQKGKTLWHAVCGCVYVFVCLCVGAEVERGTNVLQKQQGELASTMWGYLPYE